ncbi:MAG: hypothetical protein PGN37_01070 [Mycobacterium kyogaense]|uniref:hypothetical protein n=1 Tax=Mycobacterium kyogaense TaxID=2212479 RepID=UPI002FF777F9
MSEPLVESLLVFSFWCLLLSAVYCAALLTLDWLIAMWRVHRQRQRVLQARLDRIDAEARSSLNRLSAEFINARNEMRHAMRQKHGRF